MDDPIARQVIPAGSWDAMAADDFIVLDYDARHRRRFRYRAHGGVGFILDLPQATVLRHGDGLRLSDGRSVRIEAEPEALMQVGASDPLQLLRLAWHIGNRHLPADIQPHRILLRRDTVISDMLQGLGATVSLIEAPFTPEGGAYSRDGHGHSHNHNHNHNHSLSHAHAEAHDGTHHRHHHAH